MPFFPSPRLCGLLLFLFAGTSSAQTVRERLNDPGFKLYCVVFSLTVNADSTLDSFNVSRVIDFTSGTTKPVDLHVPQAFVDAARKKVLPTQYKPVSEGGNPKEYFTYYGYTPSFPATVITDLDRSLEQQP